MELKDRIVEVAKTFQGAEWVHQGRSMTRMDCAGLIVNVGRVLDLLPADFVDYTNYRRHPDGFRFKQMFEKYAVPINRGQMQNGDILIFGEGRYGYHCGILFIKNETLYMVHSYYERGKVVIEEITPKWRKVLKNVYRYQGV